jgi:hypothetical protein
LQAVSAPVGASVSSVEVALSGRSVVRGVQNAAREGSTLKRIAEALGEPEETFLDGTASRAALADTYEMLRLWHHLNRVADRKKVLALARTLAAACS